MNIVVIPSWFRNESNPISGSFFMEQASVMANHGHNVCIINIQMLSPRYFLKHKMIAVPKIYHENGILMYDQIVCSLGLGRVQNLYFNICYKFFKKAYKTVTRLMGGVDVIQAHSFAPAGIYAVRLSKDFNVPTVLTEHYHRLLENDVRYRPLLSIFPSVASSSTVVSAVSRFFAKFIGDNYLPDKKVYVVPNILNQVFTFKPVLESETFNFIYVGSLKPVKRVDLLIASFGLLVKKCPRARLILVGDGDLKSHLTNLVKALGIENFVKFTGNVSRKDVANYYASSHVFISLSETETFGVVYMESVACGRPVITCKNGGSEELIYDQNGYLLPNNVKPNAVCKSMLNMIDNYYSFDFQAMSQTMIERFGEQSVYDTYMNLYETAINSFGK